jgi:Glycosyltransferase family 9 (heptosyltransferase)
MRIITFSRRVTVQTICAGHHADIPCNGGERLIFDDDNALSIQQDPGSARYIDSVSDLAPYLTEMQGRRPANWRKTRVLFFRNRGLGDQLIASAASRFFSEMLGAHCHQAADRVHEPLWLGNPFIGGAAFLMPLHLDTVYRAKGPAFVSGSFFLESVSEWDSDSEQANVYDRMFGMLGLDPGRVAAKFKRPTLMLHKSDLDLRDAWLQKVGAALNKRLDNGYLFFQFAATNKVRSLPIPVIEKALYALNEYAEKVQLPILVTDNKPLSAEIAEMVKRASMAVNLATAINSVRLLLSLVAGATVVIGPDSSALHIAAAFEIPAIGIWGPFSPESRTRYYPRQIHLFHAEQCPHAPCFNYLPDLPVAKCPDGLNQQHCAVFDGISPEEIFEALKAVNA